MTPVDAIAATPDAAPSLLFASLRMAAVLAILAGAAYALLRFQKRLRGSRNAIEVLERAPLGRGASLALVRLGDRKLLLGISADGVRFVSEMDEAAACPGGAFAGELARAAAPEGAPR